eukprot:gene8998-1097_t
MNETGEEVELDLLKEFNFLPEMVQFLEKIKKNEKTEQESFKFETHLKSSLDLLDKLEGAELTHEQQEKILEKLEKELQIKNEKLQKFKKLEIFKKEDAMEIE